MAAKTFARSFAGGEITPEMFGRLDLVKDQTGLQTCRNFQVLPHGPVQNRAGFGYVLESKDSTKKSVLIPFVYSTTQSYALEFGNLYMRIHTQGGTVLEATKNITGITQPAGVVTSAAHGYANGDWLYMAGIGGMTQLNGRFVVVSDTAANTFRMKDFAGNYITTGSYGAYTAGGTVARVYEIATPFLEADLFDLHYTQSSDVLTIVHPTYAVREVKRLGAASWTITSPTFAPTIAAPAAPTVVPNAAGAASYSYVTTAIASDGLEESLASAVTTNAACQLLTVAGAFNTVTPAAVAGAIRYNIYKLSSGLYGYIGQTDGSGFKDENVTADTSQTPPINDAPFGSADNYPGAVGYEDGRRWFGGTNNKQQNLWGTRSGTESNMSYSIPVRDDDSIRVRLTSRQANRVLHIVSLDEMLLLTSGNEWRVSTDNSDVLTSTTIHPRIQDYIGASNVQPVVASSAVLYGARNGRVRELKLPDNSLNGQFRTNDISLLAPHLFDGYSLTQTTFTRARAPVNWWTRSDGTLLGMTYVPEQQVAAWHKHDTAGTFESVCGVPEGTEDVLYVVVKRHINGRDVRYIERQATRRFSALKYSFFVDAGVTYDSAPATVISGLWHLIGEEVSILGDGAVFPPQTVAANGSVTLEQAVSVANIGLGYTCDLETVPLAVEAAAAAGQGVPKNVNKAWMRLNQSSGVYVGPSFDNLKQIKQRTTEPYGSPPEVLTGLYPVNLTPTWQQDGSVCIRQEDPLPVTVVAMVLEVALGG